MASANEIEMLRMPCGHLAARPTKLTSTIACPCGDTWLLQRRSGEWVAQLTHTNTIGTTSA